MLLRNGGYRRGKLTRVVARPILVRSATLAQVEASFFAGPMALEHDLFFISMAARMIGMHPQTLRKYERLGLVQPTRTIGSMRLYSREELERLRLIKRMVDEAGINLAGVQRLLSIAEVVQRLRPLTRDGALSMRETRRRLVQELDELYRVLGLE